jgi:hypothetical protein
MSAYKRLVIKVIVLLTTFFLQLFRVGLVNSGNRAASVLYLHLLVVLLLVVLNHWKNGCRSA